MEVLTFEEMKRRYDGEWLMIAYTELDSEMNVIQGEVLAHSPNQEEIYQAIPLAKGKAVAFEYVGRSPEDLAFMV